MRGIWGVSARRLGAGLGIGGEGKGGREGGFVGILVEGDVEASFCRVPWTYILITYLTFQYEFTLALVLCLW